MIEYLQSQFANLQFTLLDYWIIGLNIMTLLGSPWLGLWSANNRTQKELSRRVSALRAINIFILMTYLVAGIFEFKLGQAFSQISLTIIVAFGVNHVLQLWVLSRFGTEREVNGKIVIARSYTSGMIGVLTFIIVVALAFIAVLNILDLDNWLQTSSIIGAFLLLLYASKDYLLNDIISSLLFHYNRSLEPGNVVRIRELNICGVIQTITLAQTTLRDLVQGYEITVSNSKLRNSVIENLSHTSGALKDYIDFKIGYDSDPEKVERVLRESWEQLNEEDNNLDKQPPTIKIIENGDHCVVWRMIYSVSNPYKILEVRHKLNQVALVHCHKHKVFLNTPLTHIVDGNISSKTT
ncbi:mechanosensitive ion channel domain-containing protein [Pleionea sediminis]|uniref:mechanosensitive ion channel domain-containing protein n=1 Tax=Pleionea sediminis TaxID=2569479 RepID=UPI001185868D|nr:mechanosensitive ion channel domain-containing protein [Pleionea sediminis]